jgi:hypothetical protein
MEGLMAKVIEFYVSDFWPTKSNYIAGKQRGKLIEFRAPKRNQANSNSAQWPGMCMVYMHHLRQTLRAVERATLCEQYRKKAGRSRRGTSVTSAGSFVLPALIFDFCECDSNYRLTVVPRRRTLCFPKSLATVFHIAPSI